MIYPIHYIPICACCDRETLQCDSYPSPLSGDSDQWCGSCLDEFNEEIVARAESWRDEERYFP